MRPTAMLMAHIFLAWTTVWAIPNAVVNLSTTHERNTENCVCTQALIVPTLKALETGMPVCVKQIIYDRAYLVQLLSCRLDPTSRTIIGLLAQANRRTYRAVFAR